MPECLYCSKEVDIEYFEAGKFCPFCGNHLPRDSAQDSTFIGKKIGGHYIISEKLGEGGMGYVFRARHTMLDTDVAIKVLREDFADNPESFERFRREAKSTARLEHPNAVRMFDFGQTEDGLVYIILEFIDGLDLKIITTRDGAFPEQRAIPVFIQICEVLNDAHEKGIIHRDLKSENIMLSDRGKRKDFVKVLDFGIAKLMNVGGRTTGGTITQKGVVFGTPQYMCPEQVQGAKMDQRSDIYSLGIIMYEVLTGDVPFNAPNPVDIMVQQVKDKPKSLKKVKDIEISARLEKIVFKCIEKKPQNRYKSAQELTAALKSAYEYIRSTPTSSIEDPLITSADEAPKSNEKEIKGFKLINVEGLGDTETKTYVSTPVRIGRHSSNNIVVSQPRVSKMHAEIHCEEKEYVIIDKDSLNGTYVNGKKVKAQVLRDNDFVELSKHNGLKVKFKLST